MRALPSDRSWRRTSRRCSPARLPGSAYHPTAPPRGLLLVAPPAARAHGGGVLSPARWREFVSREGAAHTATLPRWWRALSPATGHRAHRDRRPITREVPRVRRGHRAGEAPPLRTLLAAAGLSAARPRPFAV